MKKIKDGWHCIAGYNVYVEDGVILRGLTADNQRPIYTYRYIRKVGWTIESGLTPDAFRAGVKRGTIMMR